MHVYVYGVCVRVYAKHALWRTKKTRMQGQAVIIPATNKDNIWEKMAANISSACACIGEHVIPCVYGVLSPLHMCFPNIYFVSLGSFPSKNGADTIIWLSAFCFDTIFHFEMVRTTFYEKYARDATRFESTNRFSCGCRNSQIIP